MKQTVKHFGLAELLATAKTAASSKLALTSQPAGFSGEALEYRTEGAEEALTLRADGAWEQAKFLSIDACCDAEFLGSLVLKFYAKDEMDPRMMVTLGLFPRLAARVTFPLAALDVQKIFLNRTPGRLKSVCFGRRILPREIERVTLSLGKRHAPQQVFLQNIALLKSEPKYLLPERAVVDALGQWADRSWPGKTADEAALKLNLDAALKDAAAARFPAGWSDYGGTREKQFKANGFFRTEHDGKRWWLVDPAGCGFFSLGLDCMQSGEKTAIIPGCEPLFEKLPPRAGEFAKVHSRDEAHHLAYVDFNSANLIRAFGADWYERWSRLARGRLLDWRFNTVGNWSDLNFARRQKLPYVMPLGNYPTTKVMLYRDFPDVFSPEFRAASVEYAKALAPVKDDPYLIGYFMRNEPLWAFGSNNLAAELLETNPGTATRKELARWLREKYGGDVGALNKAWGKDFTAFDELETILLRRTAESSKQAGDDLWAFSRLMVREYVRAPCEEARKADPNHLNLGMRYGWISSELLFEGSEYVDVYSLNCYAAEPPAGTVEQIAEKTGKPVLIGEFHFGALDRGLPATGLCGVASQQQRGIAYRHYIEACAANPRIIGAHYFILNDQPLLGRFDGENFQIGFVDCCHTPYAEMARAARAAHEGIYQVMDGSTSPFARKGTEIPMVGF